MNCEELLLMSAEPDPQQLRVKKERLYSLAVSGKTKQYLGVEITERQIQSLSPEEISTYYSRYESKLGSRMIQSLGHTLINLYAKAVSKLVSIDSENELKYDLERDPVLTKGLESVGCDIYYRFGGLLAPLSMGLITFNHIDFEKLNFLYYNKNDGDQGGDTEGDSRGDPRGDKTKNESD